MTKSAGYISNSGSYSLFHSNGYNHC